MPLTKMIERETYVEADEKTTKALTYDLLVSLGNKIDEIKQCHASQVTKCDARIKALEDKKKKDTRTAATTGFMGGFVAMSIYWVKSWFGGD